MKGLTLAVLAAFCFGSSPILIKEGLADLDSPLVGIAIAQIFAALAYGFFLCMGRRFKELSLVGRKPALFFILTGALLATGRFCKWAALSLAPIAIVAPILGIVPLVTVGFSCIILRGIEKVTARLWFGVWLVVVGATLVTLSHVGALG